MGMFEEILEENTEAAIQQENSKVDADASVYIIYIYLFYNHVNGQNINLITVYFSAVFFLAAVISVRATASCEPLPI